MYRKQLTVTGIVIAAAGLIVLAVLGAIAAIQGIAPDQFWMAGGYGLLGVFMVLAGMGLWRIQRWGFIFYILFVVLRHVVRFPDLLTGDINEILRFVIWSVFWIILGIRLWKSFRALQSSP